MNPQKPLASGPNHRCCDKRKEISTRNDTSVILRLILLSLLSMASSTAIHAQMQPFKITSLKAQLFYEDKGTLSNDVTDDDKGPPYVPPRFWNTPTQYENRSTSMLVIVEVSGDGRRTPLPKLEFTATYIPWDRSSRPVVIRRVTAIDVPIKAKEYDKYYAAFWLYETGCNPVRLMGRVVGRNEGSVVKKVVKFGCGE